MNTSTQAHVDHTDLLQQDDHMQDMQHTQMTVTAITQPFPSIVRVKAKLNQFNPTAWQRPNLAIRLEVEAGEKRPISRVYTVRSYDAQSNEIEVDFVKHHTDSPAMRWLNQAQIGSEISLTGPRPHDLPNYSDADAPQQKQVLMFADDTAIPALYSLLQQWPVGQQATVFVESFEVDILSELPEVDGVKIHLFLQSDDIETTQPHALIDAAKALAPSQAITVWAACERQQARQLRQYFLNDYGLEKADMHAFAYWKKGVSSSEIDEVRLKHYAGLRQQGDGLKEFDDLDMPI